MRTSSYVAIGILWNFSIAVQCEEISGSVLKRDGFYVSPETNKLYVVVAGVKFLAEGKDGPPKFDEELCFGVCSSSSSEVELAWPKDKEKLCLIILRDAQGEEIAKTSLGKTIGKHFGDLRDFGKERTVPIFASSKSGPSPFLFRPCDIFRIKKPGQYILQLEFQFYQKVSRGALSEMKLMHVPVFSVPIIRDPG
jgi:hypothetical protein